MVAHSQIFPWPSYYGNYEYFERQIGNHDQVEVLTRQSSGIYDLERTQGDTLRIFVCECYAFGIAEYIETTQKIGEVDAVIINSAWCGYSPEAKQHCRSAQVGLYKIGDFMAALRRVDYWNYLSERERKFFQEHGIL